MTTLTSEQHDQIMDQFFNEAKNPAEKLLSDVLERLGVWVWGNFVSSRDILNISNEPSLSGQDLSRMDEAEHNWLCDNLDSAIDDGLRPQVVKPTEEHHQKLYSSRLYPVEQPLVDLVQEILNTFDAFVMDTQVFNNSYFKHNLSDSYDYQSCMMDDWEDMHIEDED